MARWWLAVNDLRRKRTPEAGNRTPSIGVNLVRLTTVWFWFRTKWQQYHYMRERLAVLPPINDLNDLLAWQVAMDFAVGVYEATRRFLDDEKFGLRMQLRRASVSVASNIAEGHGRINKRDYARFVLIARGSLKEAETQLLLSRRLGYMKEAEVRQLLGTAQRLNQLLGGLKRSLRK